jgi:dihydrofolate reductase|tara:strand:- start:631 stop:1146 length:516 start_codon:yes stop_codon:yes gene_type:complete
MNIILICALTKNRVIGKDNKLLWHIPEDLQNFKRLTLGNSVIMGKKTFESIGSKPFTGRNNIVLDFVKSEIPGATVCTSIPEALDKAREFGKEIFIGGGASIYKQFLPLADKMYLSYVKKEYEGDVYFPEFDESEWNVVKREDHEEFEFVEYERKPTETTTHTTETSSTTP